LLKRRKYLFVILLALAVFFMVTFTGCNQQKGDGQSPAVSGTLTIVGSTAMQPLVEEAAAKFQAKKPQVQIVVQGGGSGTGLTQVAQGAADIGNSDIEAHEKEGIEASQLKGTKVCVIGIATVTNPNCKIKNLSKKELKDIFTGKVINWKEVGGPNQKIVLVNRPKGSGTRITFKKFALDGVEEAKGMESDSSGVVRQIISNTPGAVGYLALPYINEIVNMVSIDGYAPTKENITGGTYPVWAYQYMYTKGPPAGLKKTFIDYMLSTEIQTTIVPDLEYIPIKAMKVTRDT